MTTIRTSKADQNLYSISRNIVELYAGTDRAFTQSQLLPGTVIDGKIPDDTSQPWDATLKVCDSTHHIIFSDLRANQGMENVVDCNNHANACWFRGDFGAAGQTGDQVITVKGGCTNLTFAGVIHSKGKNADVVVGNWSDQSQNPSTDLDFSGLTRADGQPVTFILNRYSRVKLPAGAKVLWVSSLGIFCYWWAKWIYVKALKLIGR